MRLLRIEFFIILFTLFSQYLLAQEKGTIKSEPPSFKLTRAEEDYSYLKNKEKSPYEKGFFDAIKYIPINKNGEIYLSLGGQIRPRFEHYSNRFWVADADQDFYSQRLALHSNIVLGKYIRVFGELYHGNISNEKAFAEYDDLDLFQLFAEIKLPIKEKQQFSFRFGRQEMGLGAARLIGIREGPNIRRSYDMARVIYTKEKIKIQAFYGKEVRPLFEAFDNDFSLFDKDATNPQLWGMYSQFPIKGLNGTNEIYYLGFQVDNATFNDVAGSENRHSLGLRRFGKIGKHWKYNSEAVYQFGEIRDDNISAFSINTDWHYELIDTKWKWSPGLKLEYASGDKEIGDDKINSFNPMFVNPAYYSLAATITPSNLIGIHPSISLIPIKSFKIYAEWAIFWRASRNDALYRPTRFINRVGSATNNRNIGHQVGLKTQYEINRHLSFDLDLSYFIAGKFLEESGESENIFHIAPTLNFRF